MKVEHRLVLVHFEEFLYMVNKIGFCFSRIYLRLKIMNKTLSNEIDLHSIHIIKPIIIVRYGKKD